MGSKVRQINEYVCAEMIKSDIELNYDKFYKDDLIRLLEACRKEYKKQKEVIDKAIEKINDYKVYCKENKGLTEYTDIEIEAIEPMLIKIEDILKEVSE